MKTPLATLWKQSWKPFGNRGKSVGIAGIQRHSCQQVCVPRWINAHTYKNVYHSLNPNLKRSLNFAGSCQDTHRMLQLLPGVSPEFADFASRTLHMLPRCSSDLQILLGFSPDFRSCCLEFQGEINKTWPASWQNRQHPAKLSDILRCGSLRMQ